MKKTLVCLSDAEIAKALNQCGGADTICRGCPFEGNPDCSATLMRIAAARLNAILAKHQEFDAMEKKYQDRIRDFQSEIVRYYEEMEWDDGS